MVIIFSDEKDYSTFEVQRWLKFYGANYVRINSNTSVLLKEVSIPEDTYIIYLTNGQTVDLFGVGNAFWYRRGKFNFKFREFKKKAIRQIVKDENDALGYFFFYSMLKNRNIIGNYLTSSLNKLNVLNVARSVGLDIPKTAVVGNESALLAFSMKQAKTITKTINAQVMFRENENMNLLHTARIKPASTNATNNFISPSLVQEEIEKEIEIRVFYVKGEFYSMAIFSQSNKKTSIDFRNYDNEKPNRTVPYKLPAGIKVKINRLMKKLFLDSGSIDMILTPENQYVFLEVNPVGQFGMVSMPCNYYLEKNIAQKLISYARK